MQCYNIDTSILLVLFVTDIEHVEYNLLILPMIKLHKYALNSTHALILNHS